jgi:alkyl hydroperoxide reductase subunit AhpC
MAQLRLHYPEIQQRGAEILQITHSAPAEARLYFKQYRLTIPYLCDPDRRVHERYGVHAFEPGLTVSLTNMVVCGAAAVADGLRGERSPLPTPYYRRHGLKDSPQAMYVVDRAGIIRHVYTTGPIGAMPSGAELLQRLSTLPS